MQLGLIASKTHHNTDFSHSRLFTDHIKFHFVGKSAKIKLLQCCCQCWAKLKIKKVAWWQSLKTLLCYNFDFHCREIRSIHFLILRFDNVGIKSVSSIASLENYIFQKSWKCCKNNRVFRKNIIFVFGNNTVKCQQIHMVGQSKKPDAIRPSGILSQLPTMSVASGRSCEVSVSQLSCTRPDTCLWRNDRNNTGWFCICVPKQRKFCTHHFQNITRKRSFQKQKKHCQSLKRKKSCALKPQNISSRIGWDENLMLKT